MTVNVVSALVTPVVRRSFVFIIQNNSTNNVAYTNTRYLDSLNSSPSKYPALVGLAHRDEALSQAEGITVLPIDQQLDQPGGKTELFSVQAQGADFSQQAFQSLYMPDWELTFTNTTVDNSQAVQSHVVKYTVYPDLSTDDYLVKAKSGNVFFVTVLRGSADTQAMLNNFIED